MNVASVTTVLRRLTLLAVLVLLTSGCGSDAGGSGKPALRVSAAASLKTAFAQYGHGFAAATPRFSFAGSDVLGAQIRAGARPDVFAAANAKLPDQLAADGLVEKPVAFARNRLVVAIPAGRHDIARVADLAKPGIRLAIGAPSVPIGSYTRDVLGRLPAAERKRILANVGSEEPDVAGVVGKVAQGAVDAAFVYASDVAAAGGRLTAVRLPDALAPVVVYEAAVVKGTAHAAEARAFVDGLLRGRGATALRRAGFLPPP